MEIVGILIQDLRNGLGFIADSFEEAESLFLRYQQLANAKPEDLKIQVESDVNVWIIDKTGIKQIVNERLVEQPTLETKIQQLYLRLYKQIQVIDDLSDFEV